MGCNNLTLCMVALGLVFIIAVVFIFKWMKSSNNPPPPPSNINVGAARVRAVPPPVEVPVENYSNLGDLDNVGSLDDGYARVQAPEDRPGTYFADMVDSGYTPEIDPTTNEIRPMQRLARIQGADLLPRTSRNVTPYNIDVADPLTSSYQVNPPRVQLKDPLWLRSDPYRGDIPIKYYPNVSLIARSRFGRDNQRLDGTFSQGSKALWDKYNAHGYRNTPVYVVNGETIMDA